MDKETLISQNDKKSLAKYLNLGSDLEHGLLGNYWDKMEEKYIEGLLKPHQRRGPDFGDSLGNICALASKRFLNLQVNRWGLCFISSQGMSLVA